MNIRALEYKKVIDNKERKMYLSLIDKELRYYASNTPKRDYERLRYMEKEHRRREQNLNQMTFY